MEVPQQWMLPPPLVMLSLEAINAERVVLCTLGGTSITIMFSPRQSPTIDPVRPQVALAHSTTIAELARKALKFIAHTQNKHDEMKWSTFKVFHGERELYPGVRVLDYMRQLAQMDDPVPWRFSCINRAPPHQTVYDYTMDLQTWQFKHGLRVTCLWCVRNAHREPNKRDSCHCRLVDSRGNLTCLGDCILFPHTLENDRCFRCMYRRSAKPMACNLCLVKLPPCDPVGDYDGGLLLECQRLRCDRYWVLDSLESSRPHSTYWHWLQYWNARVTGPKKWIRASSIGALLRDKLPNLRLRIQRLKAIRMEPLLDKHASMPAFDLELLSIYGIATLLALRQTCRAWKTGVTRKELIETLRSTAFQGGEGAARRPR